MATDRLKLVALAVFGCYNIFILPQDTVQAKRHDTNHMLQEEAFQNSTLDWKLDFHNITLDWKLDFHNSTLDWKLDFPSDVTVLRKESSHDSTATYMLHTILTRTYSARSVRLRPFIIWMSLILVGFAVWGRHHLECSVLRITATSDVQGRRL